MKSEIFTYQPTSQPNAWILLIGPDRIGSLAYDSFNRYIRHAEYTPFDLYTPTVFDQLAKELFPARAEIRKIRAAFLLPEWCWLPSAVIGEKDAQKWLAAQWPEKPGHEWVADRNGPAEATAWVRVPSHLINQLKKLSADVQCTHAAPFISASTNNSMDRMEIIRMGNWCWFSIWKQNQFHYAQPHYIGSTDDLLYVLSLLAAEYKFSPDQMDVQLLGEWPVVAEELSALRARFRNLHGTEVGWKDLPGDQPPHWFTPLAKILS